MNIKNKFISSMIYFGFLIFFSPSIFSASASNVSSRNMMVINNCPFPVWLGSVSGVYKDKNNQTIDCLASPEICPGSNNQGTGTTYCGVTAVVKGIPKAAQCFWGKPIVSANQPIGQSKYYLSPEGGTLNLNFQTLLNNPHDATWSGTLAGRTNCLPNGVCESADCGVDKNGDGGCAEAKGFMQPATQVEMTFNQKGNDFYDVEVVNGANIPVQIEPQNPRLQEDNYYWCGSPGATSPLPGANQPSCSWIFTPPLNEYYNVSGGGKKCEVSSECESSQQCGLTALSLAKKLRQKTCGKVIGYWNANEICGTDRDYGAPLNCALPLSGEKYAQRVTVTNLLQCHVDGNSKVMDTCFKKGASSNCCGYTDWGMIDGVFNSFTAHRNQIQPLLPVSNKDWQKYALPSILWLKKACPTAYTYPFDDPASTFQCRSDKSVAANSMAYTITFCPKGNTGGVLGK
jgi:hypothetical protein